MKRTLFTLIVVAALSGGFLRAQDAATQERLDKLSGQIEDIIATQRAQQKQLDALGKEVDALRDQASKHTGNYASQEDLKHIAESIKEVDRKRMADTEMVAEKLAKLGKSLTSAISTGPKAGTGTEKGSEKATPEKGYPYTVQPGDTLSVIIQAYREKNIKVTVDQILKANPGLKADKLPVGKKIYIPAPQ